MIERKKISWPETEPIPQSPEEALRLGWTGGKDVALDVPKGRGQLRFWKQVGTKMLFFEIPVTATLSFGAPCKMNAEKPDYLRTPKKLWDVLVESKFLRAKRTVRVFAHNEDDAGDVACDAVSGETYDIQPAKKDGRRHVAYIHKPHRGSVPIRVGKRAAR